MKIPPGYFGPFISDNKEWTRMCEFWQTVALEVSTEYGILIETCVECDGNGPPIILSRHYEEYPTKINRIFFRIGDMQFESLNALRTALKNKAFM